MADSNDTPVTFSDGTTFLIPAGTSPQEAQAGLDNFGASRAAAGNSPVSGGGFVYSETRRHPDNWMGQAMAWSDQHMGGNWANRNIADPLNYATGGEQGLGPAAYRVAMQGAAGPADLAAQVYNVTPLASQTGKAPILSQKIIQGTGMPELSPDAPEWQRAAENVASAVVGSRLIGGEYNPVGNVVGTAAGMGASAVGEKLGGETGGVIGGLAGGGGAALAGRGLLHAAAPALAHENAGAIYDAAQESGIPLSFRTLANPTGQRIAASAGSVPIFGGPIEAANEATRKGIQDVRDAQANAIAGPGGVPPGGATRESIGADVVRAAQDAVQQQKAREDTAWQPINQAMQGGTADIRNIPAGAEPMLSGNQQLPSVEDAARGKIQELTDIAPGGPRYQQSRVGGYAPQTMMPWEVPWNALKQWTSGLTQNLGRGDIQIPGNVTAALKNLGVDAQSDAATRAGLPPGTVQNARQVSADVHPILDQLYPISGQPIGDTGQFRNPMGEGQAYGFLTRNLNSPENLAPLADSGSPVWNRAAGSLISTLGDRGPGNFRPEKFTEDLSKIGPGVQTQLMQGPSGGAVDAFRHLQNAGTVGSNFVTPTSRFGLTSSLGTSYVMSEAMRHLGEIGHAIAGPVGRYALPPLVLFGGTRGLESPGMHAAMAGRSAGLAGDIYRTIPRLAQVTRPQQQ